MKSKFTIRVADWKDIDTLMDIDLKCFDFPWNPAYWGRRFEESQMALIVDTSDGVPAGLLMGELLEDGLVIEKIGVKPAYRRQGASRLLLDACDDLTIQCPESPMDHIVIPEPWLYRDSPDCIAPWLKAVGFKARLPYLKDYYCINGVDFDGVKCERAVG